MKQVKKLDEKAILSRLSNGALSNTFGGVSQIEKSNTQLVNAWLVVVVYLKVLAILARHSL